MKLITTDSPESTTNEHKQIKPDRKLFDVEGIVAYLTEQGATGVTINFVRNLLILGPSSERESANATTRRKNPSIFGWPEVSAGPDDEAEIHLWRKETAPRRCENPGKYRMA